MNLTSILSEIKVVPAGAAGGLVPGDLVEVYWSYNFDSRDDNEANRIKLKINTIDKVKETPKKYRIWRNTLTVYFYPKTKTYEIGEIESDGGDLYSKDYYSFKYINNLSNFSLDRMKNTWAKPAFKENKIDLKVLNDIVIAFYKQYYDSFDSTDRVIKSSKEKLFKKAYKELKKAEDSFVKVKDKTAKDNLDWIEPIALDIIQRYSNADMSTYKKS